MTQNTQLRELLRGIRETIGFGTTVEQLAKIDAALAEPVEEDTGLIALLTDAMHELDVLGSYVDDPDIVWPTLGLKVTAKAHKALAVKIKDALVKHKEEVK